MRLPWKSTTTSTRSPVGANHYTEIASAYEAERPRFEALAKRIEMALKSDLESAGVYCEVTCRAKEVASFVKKALREGYADPMVEIGDKAGVRVIVPYLEDVRRVETFAEAICSVKDREEKLEALDYNQLGYLGVHLELVPRPGLLTDRTDLGPDDPSLDGLRAELQIHSKAQSAWAVVSHDLLYKPPVEAADETKRAVTRLVALVELFDGEIDRLRKQIASDPDYAEMAVAAELDDRLLHFTPRSPDRKLSLLSVPTLVHLYKCPPTEVVSGHVDPYLKANQQKLQSIYDAYENDETANPLLTQPEAFLIFERLQNDRDHLKESWPIDRLDLELLEGMGLIIGIEL
jgi:ppGpp synthetase/RelA/SpoT-type nucleotidyltranferase